MPSTTKVAMRDTTTVGTVLQVLQALAMGLVRKYLLQLLQLLACLHPWLTAQCPTACATPVAATSKIDQPLLPLPYSHCVFEVAVALLLPHLRERRRLRPAGFLGQVAC